MDSLGTYFVNLCRIFEVPASIFAPATKRTQVHFQLKVKIHFVMVEFCAIHDYSHLNIVLLDVFYLLW